MAKHQPRLEVFPEHTDTLPGTEEWARKHYVRLVAGNGATLMTSESYGHRGNAVRAAVAINRATSSTRWRPDGRLPIVVLNSDGTTHRTIRPGDVHLTESEAEFFGDPVS